MPFSATDVKHYDGFFAALDRVLRERPTLRVEGLREQYMALEGFSNLYAQMPVEGMGDYTPLWLAAKVMEGDAPVEGQGPGAGRPGGRCGSGTHLRGTA